MFADIPSIDEWQQLEEFLSASLNDIPNNPSKYSWEHAIQVLVKNGIAWTDAIAQREALRAQYVTQNFPP